MRLTFILSIAFWALGISSCSSAYEIVNYKEQIIFENTPIPALLDTGATTTAIDAKDISISKFGWVTFTFYGKKVERGLVRYAEIITNTGVQKRPVVRMTLSLNGIDKTVEVSLMNRSNYPQPILIGRNFLKDDFAVISN